MCVSRLIFLHISLHLKKKKKKTRTHFFSCHTETHCLLCTKMSIIILKKLICNEHRCTENSTAQTKKKKNGRNGEKKTYQPLLLFCLVHGISMDSPPLNIVYEKNKNRRRKGVMAQLYFKCQLFQLTI